MHKNFLIPNVLKPGFIARKNGKFHEYCPISVPFYIFFAATIL